VLKTRKYLGITQDLFLSLDWLDEMGCYGQGLAIQADHLLTRLILPPKTLIFEQLMVLFLQNISDPI